MTDTTANKGYTVLIVEDEKSLREALAKKFTHEGFGVLTAENGEKGYALAVENRPAVILLDIVMPKMDGIAVVQKLRIESTTKDIPIILLTNLSENEKIAEAVQFGVFDYLIKSDWKIEDVVAKVKEKLHI
jgi:DNA-binding response OmpR family regulator